MLDTVGGRVPRATLNLPVPYRAPSPGFEQIIAASFGRAFNVEDVGADDDFYDLGGDSLLGEALSIEILNATGKVYQVSWFYEDGTPAKVARRLTPTQPASLSRPPIFMVHGRAGYSSPKVEFRKGLAPDQKLIVFELPGIRGNGESYETIEDISRAYVGQLLAEYPEGPILLGSFCAGSLIAVEMAAQLANMSRPVHHLLLIDPGSSGPLDDRHWIAHKAQGLALPQGWASKQRGALYRIGWSLLTLPVLGRVFDGATERDFADPRLRRLRVWVFYWRAKLRELRGKSERRGQSFSLLALMRLRAAYLHYWPQVFTGSVDVLSSAARKSRLEGNELWASLLPNMKLTVVAETHRELVNGTSGVTAREMQRIFDTSLERAPSVAKAAE